MSSTQIKSTLVARLMALLTLSSMRCRRQTEHVP